MENPKINSLNTSGTGSGQQARREQAAREQAMRESAARQRTGAGSGAPSSRGVGPSSDYGVVRSPGGLSEGDIIRGEISDLRNNEITVTLEDNTILKARVSDPSMLSIGQTAAFRLAGTSMGSILLEAIKNSYSQTELTLVNKALDEAGLPATEHNQDTVKALMDNMLPITKESIQHLMQQSYDYKTSDMNTLALMNRLMMEMTPETVNQFSSYRNGAYRLLGQLVEFSQNIPALLGALAQNGPADSVALFGDRLLSIALYGSGNDASLVPLVSDLTAEQRQALMDMLSNTPLAEDIFSQLENGTLSIRDALLLIRDAISSGTIKLPEGMSQSDLTSALLLINSALEPAAGSEAIMQETENSIKNMPVLDAEAIGGENEKNADDAMGEAAKEAASDGGEEGQNGKFAFANRFLRTLTETARNSISSTLSFLQQAAAGGAEKSAAGNTVIDILAEMSGRADRENDSLNTFLSPAQRSELLGKLETLPVSRELLAKIASGEASAKEVMQAVKDAMAHANPEAVQELFKSPAFANIFGRFLQSSWTISPEKLRKDGGIDSFYNKMHAQLKQFEGLIQTALSGDDSDSMGRSARDMENNIEFMKTLSETFSYVQMPLKLQNQDAHADLYVYTQKEKLRKNPDDVHVLLHLSLEHMGDVDIYLDKRKSEINARFSLADEDSVNLIRTNADMLKGALNRQGYACNVRVDRTESEPATVDDFINTKINTSATADMKRFSFDVRA